MRATKSSSLTLRETTMCMYNTQKGRAREQELFISVQIGLISLEVQIVKLPFSLH